MASIFDDLPHLLVVKSKNKRPRTIPMTARVRSELLQVIQDRTQGPVFLSARTGVNLVTIKKGFKPLRFSNPAYPRLREYVVIPARISNNRQPSKRTTSEQVPSRRYAIFTPPAKRDWPGIALG